MAVTSIWDIKGRVDKALNYAMNPEKTTESSLHYLATLHAVEDAVEYASNQLKTEKKLYVKGINCDPEIAAKQFLYTKNHWKKTDGIVAFHAYQSFLPGEVDAEAAHEIGIKLAEELWGDRFEVVVATHVNTGHYHNHFVLNSVSFKDGKRYYDHKRSYHEMRSVSDCLCREHRLLVISSPSNCGKHYSEWSSEMNGKPTYRSTIRNDIDRAILASTTERDFRRVMADMGYEFKTHGESGSPLKYPALKPPGAKGFFRFHKLGEHYSLSEIRERILQNIHKQVPFPVAKETPSLPRHFNGNWKCEKKIRGLRALYLRYCYELRIIKKRQATVKRLPFSIREDLIKLDRYIAQARLLGSNALETMDELHQYSSVLHTKITALTSQRTQLRSALKRAVRSCDTASESLIKKQISELSAQLKTYRKELELCEEIALRSDFVKAALEHICLEKENLRKERREHELLRGSSRTGSPNDLKWC